jgi:hypothetical protein
MSHGDIGVEVAARSRRAQDATAKIAWLLGGTLAAVNLFGLIAGFSLGTESAWFSEEVERFGWIAATMLAVILVGGTIAWLAVNLGAHKPMTWVMGVVFALVGTQLTLISGVVVTEALTLWLSSTPHREAAKFYSAGPTGGTGRSAKCEQKIAVRPALSRFKGLIPSFCAPEAVVEPGLKRDDEIVLVGRAGRLGFVVERVERAR